MSKYHELRKASEQDWTTAEGIAAGVQSGLRLKGYGTAFQIWRDGVPIDEGTARQAIVDKISSPPVMEIYQRSLQRLIHEEGDIGFYEISVEAEPPALMFEHGNFRHPMELDGFEVVVGEKDVERRRKRRTKKEIGKEEKARRLDQKLEDTKNTDEAHYLVHANQCGYLVGNTSIRFFNAGRGQWGISVMTRINGISLSKLQEFIDSTGTPTLSGVSTHADTSLADLPRAAAEAEPHCREDEGGITAMHGDFAKDIVDFLNLEFRVEIDETKAQYKDSDSRFQSIEHWGGGRDMVLERLLERRGEGLNPDDITEAFEMGYKGELLV